MKQKPEATGPTVARIANHPKQVLKRVRAVAESGDNIQWSYDVNDLELARKVQIRTILKCLREGELDESSVEAGGDYVRGIMRAVIGGMVVTVEFFLGPGKTGLTVIDADAEEEE